MSYNAQQAMLENESLLKEWHKDLQYVIDGEEGEAIVYKGPVTGLSHLCLRPSKQWTRQ